MTDHSAQYSFTVTDVRGYYQRLRDLSDIGAVAHELLGDRITQESRSTIYVDCPRHESQSGRSFTISLHLGAWYCHACRAGGGVIELVEFVQTGAVTKCSRSGVTDTHKQARDWLAERAGMPKLSEAGISPEKIAEQEKLRVEAEQVFACLTAYAEICHAALLANAEALAWLKENYAINDESIAQHRIGWADDAGAFDLLVQLGFTPEIIAATGLFRLDLSSPAPFFRKRVVFPYWADGRVTYMTGRRTPWSEDNEYELAKYKKLPLYDEKKHPHISKAITNSTLFGEDILRTRPPQVVLTEGITDAIASMQAGFATISPATVNIGERDFDRIVAKLKGVEGVQIAFDNELSAIGADSAIEIARRLDRAGIPAEIITLPLREKQEKARAEFAALLGGACDDYLHAPANKRAEILKEALKERLDDVERAKGLVADAKIDVNEWFKTGGTPEAFAELLATGRNHILVQIDQVRAIGDPDELARAFEPILRDIAAQGQVAREKYLQLLKEKTGLGIVVLRRMVGEFVQDARKQERRKKVRDHANAATRPTYRATADGLVLVKPVDGGTIEVPLTNFTATITATIIIDNGVDVEIHLEIEAHLRGATRVLQVASKLYSSMSWALEHLGPSAIIFAGFSLKDHARAAIQVLSGEKKVRRILAHSGWREIEGHGWCYLHAGGAIGASGLIDSIEVQLPAALAPMVLPKPPEGVDLVKAIGSSLELLLLGPPRVMFVVMAAVWRAVLGGTDFSVHLAGPTGVFKSEVAALAQAFFGALFNARNLPGSWSSTGNALEALLFAAKDMLTVVDDFAPTGSSHDVQRYHREADRLLRAVGNRSGRGRLRPDGTLRPVHPPRGVALSTGEDIPAGQSLRARMLIVELEHSEIDARVLTVCQRAAADGLYAATMAGFLKWLALRYQETLPRIREREVALRGETKAEHRRTPAVIAQIQAGMEVFLEFAVEAGTISKEIAEDTRTRCWTALQEAADAQARHILAAEPTAMFFALLRSAVAAGEAHVADKRGEHPDEVVAVALGWDSRVFGSGEHERTDWVHKGARIGWVDGAELYLDLPAAYQAAQGQAGDTERLTVSMRTLSKRLAEKGYLVTQDEERGKNTIRKMLQGARQVVLHVRADVLLDASGPMGRGQDAAQNPDVPGDDEAEQEGEL